jgi:hypothetical protein
VHPGLLDTDGEAQDPKVSSSVYLETSIISYLTSLPSRDLITAAHQELTRMWWSTRGRFDLFISQAVLSEAAAGDPEAAARRLGAVSGIRSSKSPQRCWPWLVTFCAQAPCPPRPLSTGFTCPLPLFTGSTICSPGIAGTLRTPLFGVNWRSHVETTDSTRR